MHIYSTYLDAIKVLPTAKAEYTDSEHESDHLIFLIYIINQSPITSGILI